MTKIRHNRQNIKQNSNKLSEYLISIWCKTLLRTKMLRIKTDWCQNQKHQSSELMKIDLFWHIRILIRKGGYNSLK